MLFKNLSDSRKKASSENNS